MKTNLERYKTVEGRAKAFREFCESHAECAGCCLRESGFDCKFAWLELEAEEEKPLPCPICGSPCLVYDNVVECSSGECAYTCWRKGYSPEMNIDVHNRVARAVMAMEKKGPDE